ncbi:MAG: cytochrome c biogenesis protein ResB [Thermodesulfobacteriota bacterium]|nr:cytochrome c biogenesis protein ResB [Thermodesulfobacteriota bacterium]
MAKIELTNPLTNQFWKFFTSVKLTVVVLLLLAATSVIGTLIPQNASSAFYFQKYGEVFYRLFKAFDIFDMYHSWWFLMLLGLLGINLIICSIDRLSTTWKIIFPEKIVFNREQFRKIKEKKEFTSKEDVEELRKKYKAFLEKKFTYVVEENTEKGVCIFGEKGRWTRFGVYIVHFSFLLLLGGGVIGGIWGYKGYVQLIEGESVKSVDARDGKGKIDLGFALRCNTFDVSFYDTGQPDEYKSNVSVLEDGKEVLTTDIIVNDPLRYKGISFYQSNYGTAAGREVELVFKSRETGMVYNKKTAVGEAVSLPEGGGRFILDGFVPGFDFRGHNLGESFVGRVVNGDEKEETIVMPIKFPFFDKMRKGAFSFEVEKFEKKYYTGLQVTKDPGVWYVYSGFIFMIIGCWITFFMSHQRICVEVEKGNSSSRVIIAGTAHRNTQSMKIKTAGIAEKMKEI